MNIEHFIDRYVPIRFAMQIEDYLKNTLPEKQFLGVENYHMLKMKSLYEHVLHDEKRTDLKQKCEEIMHQLDKAIEKSKEKATLTGLGLDVHNLSNVQVPSSSHDTSKQQTSRLPASRKESDVNFYAELGYKKSDRGIIRVTESDLVQMKEPQFE